MEQEARLRGTITPLGTLTGHVGALGTLRGSAAIPKGYATYSGPYEVTPKLEAQQLETKGCVMSDNVNVGAIPLFVTANSKGNTLYIGGIIHE